MNKHVLEHATHVCDIVKKKWILKGPTSLHDHLGGAQRGPQTKKSSVEDNGKSVQSLIHQQLRGDVTCRVTGKCVEICSDQQTNKISICTKCPVLT